MAKGVAKSFRKHLSSFINFYVAMENGIQADEKAIRTLIKEYLPSIQSDERERETLRIALIALQINIDKEHLARIIEKADTERYASGNGRIYTQPEHDAFSWW